MTRVFGIFSRGMHPSRPVGGIHRMLIARLDIPSSSAIYCGTIGSLPMVALGDHEDPLNQTSQAVGLEMLLERFALGDQAAFRQLYDLSSPRLYAVALRITRQPSLA